MIILFSGGYDHAYPLEMHRTLIMMTKMMYNVHTEDYWDDHDDYDNGFNEDEK